MTTRNRQRTQVRVSVMERSVVFILNSMFRALTVIAGARRLGVDHLVENRDMLNAGLFTWLAEGTLQEAFLEVYQPGTDTACERWSFRFDYDISADAAPKQPDAERLRGVCHALESLPPGARYRVVARTASGATRVPGWEPTELRKLARAGSQVVEDWGCAGVAVQLTLEGAP